MRKYFLDNIRTICVLLLFPYHTFMMYNNWGENFYVKGKESIFASGFVVAAWPWIMPLMFVIAGMSLNYSMKKRTAKDALKERTMSLFIPLIAGILILCPMMTFFAEKFHNGYTGNYFEQYVLFFSGPTDLTGSKGGFTPGHLWFILYLFAYTLLALPIVLLTKKSKKKIPFEKFPLVAIVSLFILVIAAATPPEIGGKELLEFFVLFLLGYYVLSNDKVLDKLENNRFILFGGFIILMVLHLLFWSFKFDNIGIDIFQRLFGWVGVLSFLGMGKRYLNQNNTFTRYCSKASFPVYILHQSILVMTAYYVFMFANIIALQAALVILISLALTMVCYEILRRIPFIRVLFGIRIKKKENISNIVDVPDTELKAEEN